MRRVSEDEVFAACMIEAVHLLDLPLLFPLALKNSLNLNRLVHYELKLYQSGHIIILHCLFCSSLLFKISLSQTEVIKKWVFRVKINT